MDTAPRPDPPALRFGLTLSSEEFGPAALVDQAVRAAAAGFDFVSVSDHFHPWTRHQGHSPFVWTVLGAVAAATTSIDVAVGVSCPLVRLHPVLNAHATATAALLLPGRFTWGVGTGEALNEHVLGHRWPPADTRRQMLEEALDVIRRLWSGASVDHHGTYYTVENARLFDVPDVPPPVVVSGFGPESVALAARIGDGYWGTSPDAEAVERFVRSGGSGPRYGQLSVCVGPDTAECRRTVHRVWPNGAIPGQLSQDLPTPTHFEQAATLVTEDQAVDGVPCGPDPEPVLEALRTYVDAGYDHVYLHQIGPDQAALRDLWRRELAAPAAALAGDRSPVEV